MSDTSWQVLLPRLFASAGIDAGGEFEVLPLTGGVSSDIVRIRLKDGREFCAKRALGQLKVAEEWKAPLERNHYEVAWLQRAGAIVPGSAPRVFAEDREHGVALLEYLPAEDFVLWKSALLSGWADAEVAVAVANVLGRIHAATLNDADVAAEFPTDHLIDALRFDPYLRFTAGRYPELSQNILGVLRTTATTKLALVHGDVSPKNILVSKRDGHPVLLDAECAWYGDPAFDAAFCLNHLVLKSVHLPALREELLDEAVAFAREWLSHFPDELRAGLDQRTAALLPCLMLARIDGKSPVEYLGEPDRQRVRELAMPMIASPPRSIVDVIERVSP
ncbi:MAG TPA: aminoglycoside phosphotransferase family protein [Devosia sp.]|nr:aminoglycoside phosphotransferase family protein [Devosia sp.]